MSEIWSNTDFPYLRGALRRSIALNPQVADRVRVVEGDAAVADLPRGADVVLAEASDPGDRDEHGGRHGHRRVRGGTHR